MIGRKVNAFWSLSLILIGIATIILSVNSIFSLSLSDVIIRILGIIDLISLPILAFTTIIKVKNKDN